MANFSDELRQLRARYHLTQQALADRLDGELSRTTIANVETNRQVPSARLWALLEARFPLDTEQMADAYKAARISPARLQNASADETNPPMGGHVSIERYDIIYNFRDSRVPEEVIELRHVKATRHGAQDFALRHSHTESDGFQQSIEVLFGGHLVATQRQTANHQTLYTWQIRFDRELNRSERHSFGVRYWVERDPVPTDSILVEMTIPTQLVILHVNFWGSSRPAVVWHYGPEPDRAVTPGRPTAVNQLRSDRTVSAWFERPAIGSAFGLAWRW